MKIIYGTDLTTNANEVAMAAAALAARFELPLVLAHVLDQSRYSAPSAGLLDHLRVSRQKKLQALAERAGRRGVIVETTIMEGSPAMKLAELATDSEARLLVVSSRGQIAPTQWLAGSVADQAVQMSQVPTLVVRDPRLIESWLGGDRPLKIVVGYDFSASSDAAIRWVASLDAIGPCDITIAYVASPANERSRLGIAPPLSPLYYPSALRKFLEEEIASKTAELLGDKAEIHVKADWGRPDAQLLEMGTDSHADLMVVGTSQRRGLARLGSVARAVMHYSHKNVGCVPEAWVTHSFATKPLQDVSVSRRGEGVGQKNQQDYALN